MYACVCVWYGGRCVDPFGEENLSPGLREPSVESFLARSCLRRRGAPSASV